MTDASADPDRAPDDRAAHESPRARPAPGPRPAPAAVTPATGKPSKAQRLEAKAARLREAEQRRRTAQPAGVTAARRISGPILAVVVLGVVTAVLVALLIAGYLSWQHQRDVNAARSSATDAAQKYAVDFGSYDYRHLDADFKKVATHLTPDFKKSYLDSSSKLEPTIVQYKGRSVASVQGLGVTSASTSKAVLVVLLDQTVTTSQSSTPRIDRNRLVMTLVRPHGTWLISKLVTK